MPGVKKKHKRTKHSTIDDYEGITNDCNELKMTLVFKKNGGNKPHSLVPQERSCSCVTSSNESRMFPSHRHHPVGSIENPKEFHRKRAFSSVPIRLLPATEKEEAFSEGLRRSLRIREKTLHLYAVKKHGETQKQSTNRKSCPNSTSSSPKVSRRMVSKTTQDSSFFHRSKMDFNLTSLRRKSLTASAIQVDEATKQISPINSSFSSLNFTRRTASKIPQNHSFLLPNITWIPSTVDERIFSNYQADENIYPRFENVYPPQVAWNLTQQRKSISLFYPEEFQFQDKTFQRNNFYSELNQLDEYCDSYHRNAQKKAAKRKWWLNSAFSSTKFMRGMYPKKSKTMQGFNFKFDNMFSTPPRRKFHTSSATQLNDRAYPKFANADRSQVVSGSFEQEIIIKTSASGKVISLFNLDARQIETYQNIVFSSDEKGTPQYKFKEETVGLQYLSKKYPMMDPFTLNKCYGLSNCNIRKAEIILQDVLAGKEVFLPPDCSCTLSKQRRLCKKFS